MTVVVLGAGRVRHLVNGEEVLTYSHPQLDRGDAHAGKPALVSQGYIALQSESHPIDFKTVALLDLTGCTDSAATTPVLALDGRPRSRPAAP